MKLQWDTSDWPAEPWKGPLHSQGSGFYINTLCFPQWYYLNSATPVVPMVFQASIPRICISCSMLSAHISEGLPLFLSPTGFVKLIFLHLFMFSYPKKCCSHLTLPVLTSFIISGFLCKWDTSWLHLRYCIPLSLIVLCIFLRMLLSDVLQPVLITFCGCSMWDFFSFPLGWGCQRHTPTAHLEDQGTLSVWQLSWNLAGVGVTTSSPVKLQTVCF